MATPTMKSPNKDSSDVYNTLEIERSNQFSTTTSEQKLLKSSHTSLSIISSVPYLFDVTQSYLSFGSIATGMKVKGTKLVEGVKHLSAEVKPRQLLRLISQSPLMWVKSCNDKNIVKNTDEEQHKTENKQVSKPTPENKKQDNLYGSNPEVKKKTKEHAQTQPFTKNVLKGLTFAMMICSLPKTSLAGPIGQYINAGTGCRATLSDSTPYEHSYKQIECGLAHCLNKYRIVFEKTGIDSSQKWTPVFEGFNKTHFHDLDNNAHYTLAKRSDYAAFHTNHILHINDPIPSDQGQWRCAVYDDNRLIRVSKEIAVSVFVTPDEHNVNIAPFDRPLVTGEKVLFTCTVNGVFPLLGLQWTLNGEERKGGTAVNKQRNDGLWMLENTIYLEFDLFGVNVVSCLLIKAKSEPWLQRNLNLTVRAAATVLYPLANQHLITNRRESLTLNCSGKGYQPHMAWMKDGTRIEEEDENYLIENVCNKSVCIGSITTKPVNPCDSHYPGEYTCVFSLEPTYQSEQTSAFIHVDVSQAHCNGNHMHTNGFFVLVVMVALLLLMTLGVLIRMKQQQPQQGIRSTKIPADDNIFPTGITSPENREEYIIQENRDIEAD